MSLTEDLKVVTERISDHEIIRTIGHGPTGFPTLEEALEATQQTYADASRLSYLFLLTHATELQGLVKDAERYRFLRKHLTQERRQGSIATWIVYLRDEPIRQGWTYAQLQDSIDAAIAATAREG